MGMLDGKVALITGGTDNTVRVWDLDTGLAQTLAWYHAHHRGADALDLTLDQMRARVASLPPHSAVLYAFVMIDAAGVPYERGVALQRLLEVSTAPVFSMAESEAPDAHTTAPSAPAR